MNRILFIAVLCVAVAPALATVNFFDDFENGVGGDIVWAPWGGVSGNPTTPIGSANLFTTSTSHSIGTQSAFVPTSDPANWNGYADFGSTADSVRAEVWVYEDHSYTGTQPVTNMLCLIGDNGTGTAGFQTDFLQLGAVSFWPGGSGSYGRRTAAGGMADFGISRKAGWTKLAIEADSIASGGQVRFYIDDILMPTTSQRTATNLRWVRLGNNSKNYENFWYDNVRVIPEPASLVLLGMGGVALLRRRRA